MTVLLSPWRSLFEGIEHAAGMADVAFSPDPAPRDQRVQIVRIDLESPRLRFFTTPTDPASLYQTKNSTILDFLAAYPEVQLAINANLAWADNEGNASLFGLAKSEGNLVSDPTVPAPQPPPGSDQPNVPDASYTGTVALTITRDNRASFHILNAQSPAWSPRDSHEVETSPWRSIYTAVAGSPNVAPGWPPMPFVGGLNPGESMVLRNGVNNGVPTGSQFVAARTAIGLDAAARTLFLLTIDGIEGANPQYGATFYDTGEWLKLAGASDGINLDGGGSTAMAVKVGGSNLLMNVPHGSEGPPYVQRPNAQFFGIIPG